MKLFLIAGEPSGDILGARLIAALRARAPELEIAGIGGPEMTAQGLASQFPMAELSLMGLAEVLPHLPRLLRRITETEQSIRRYKPDALVTIDAPSFTLRVAKRLADSGIPRIHYVAPQVWAWRPGRAKTLARKVDRLLCLLPFEPKWFEAHGLAADFVGHPVVETPVEQWSFRERYEIGDGPLIVVLPGSRRGEVSRHLGVFGATVAQLADQVPGLRVVVPTVPAVAEIVRAAVSTWVGDPMVVTDAEAKHAAFQAADAALAASGTVALELALANCPAVIAYRVNPITAAVVRRLIQVRYVALPNLIAEREIYPERLQQECVPEPLAAALLPLLTDAAARDAQRAGLRRVAAELGAGSEPPSARAAAAVLQAARTAPPSPQAGGDREGGRSG